MKNWKRIILILFTYTLLHLVYPGLTLAKNVVLYRSSESPTTIFVKLNFTTTIRFVSDLEEVISPSVGFKINFLKKSDKMTITPVRTNTQTNITVYTADGLSYTFRVAVVGDNDSEFYDVVEMRPTAEIDYKALINITNKKTVEIDPALRDVVDVYDVNDNSLTIANSKLKVYLKRVVVANRINKTSIWLRLENTHDISPTGVEKTPKDKKKVLNPNDIAIAVTKFLVINHPIFAVCMEDQKEVLHPQEYVDVYLLLDEGGSPDSSYTITLNINGQDQSFTLSNLPYRKQVFKVFVTNGKSYESVIIDDYWRQP